MLRHTINYLNRLFSYHQLLGCSEVSYRDRLLLQHFNYRQSGSLIICLDCHIDYEVTQYKIGTVTTLVCYYNFLG